MFYVNRDNDIFEFIVQYEHLNCGNLKIGCKNEINSEVRGSKY